mmetsp:Transcript_124230/g.215344  ORF Transcript_124230/g.215344 Transcript_124230/m.215344 type:complete len:126 (-) Transcript_124230:218-595(-)
MLWVPRLSWCAQHLLPCLEHPKMERPLPSHMPKHGADIPRPNTCCTSSSRIVSPTNYALPTSRCTAPSTEPPLSPQPTPLARPVTGRCSKLPAAESDAVPKGIASAAWPRAICASGVDSPQEWTL